MNPASLLERLLIFMDKPWKAAVTIVLLILAGVGWFVYAERVRIADAILSKSVTPEFNLPRFARDAPALLRDTKADGVLLLAINLNDNLFEEKLGFDKAGNEWAPVRGTQMALYPDTPMQTFLAFLRNEVVCEDLTDKLHNEEFRTQAMLGMTRACAVTVPPVVGVLVGVLVVSWRQPLPADQEAKARVVMAASAMKFATW